MKYLKKFFEGSDYKSIIKEVESLKYILEDEGYSFIIKNKQLSGKSLVVIEFIKGKITRDHMQIARQHQLSVFEYDTLKESDFFEEFMDRVREICQNKNFSIQYMGEQMSALYSVWVVAYIPDFQKGEPHYVSSRKIDEFHNSTSLWKTGVNYPETEVHPTLHPDLLGKDYNYLTVSEILIYLNQNNNIKKEIEKSGNSVKISFEVHNIDVSVYRSLVDKNNFEYLVEIDGKEIDCKNEIGERMFTILYAKKISENLEYEDKLDQIAAIFSEYKYILEDEGVLTRCSIESPYRANPNRIQGKAIIYLLIQNTEIFKKTLNGDDVVMKFIHSDYYQEFADRFLEEIYSKGLSNQDNVFTKFGGNNGIIIKINLI